MHSPVIPFVDAYHSQWLEELDAIAHRLQANQFLHLLVDGAFFPGLHLQVNVNPHMLFEGLPGYSDLVRDVSPFIVNYADLTPELKKRLQHCSGLPMFSAILTVETSGELAGRLSAWCVVKADGQNFNFRFPDTRRLPDILSVLDPTQLAQFGGPASVWMYMARDGRWSAIELTPSDEGIAVEPELSKGQFAQMVDRSEADGILSRLAYFDFRPHSPLKSVQHAVVAGALVAGRHAGIADGLVSEWCRYCLENTSDPSAESLKPLLNQWTNSQEMVEP